MGDRQHVNQGRNFAVNSANLVLCLTQHLLGRLEGAGGKGGELRPQGANGAPKTAVKEVVVSCQSSYRTSRAERRSSMLAYLKVDPRLRFLKLSMVAADCVLDENLWCFCLFASLRNE